MAPSARYRLHVQQFPLALRSTLHTKIITNNQHQQADRHAALFRGLLDQVAADMVKATYVSPRSSAVTFGEVAKEWIEAKRARKPKTVAGYVSLLDNLVLPKWRDVKLADVSHADVQRWVSGLSRNGSVRTEGKGLSASRVLQAHQVFGAILKYAIKYAIKTERLGKNVATGVELPRKASKEHNYLTHEQVWSLADAVGDAARDAGLHPDLPDTYADLTNRLVGSWSPGLSTRGWLLVICRRVDAWFLPALDA